jgi:hypothetical protein
LPTFYMLYQYDVLQAEGRSIELTLVVMLLLARSSSARATAKGCTLGGLNEQSAYNLEKNTKLVKLVLTAPRKSGP